MQPNKQTIKFVIRLLQLLEHERRPNKYTFSLRSAVNSRPDASEVRLKLNKTLAGN